MRNYGFVGNVLLGTAVLFLLCGCLSPGRRGRLDPERADSFSFVVMGDNRPPGGSDRVTQPPFFHRAIEEVNLLDPDFVVIVGDLIYGYEEDADKVKQMWDEFDAAAAEFKAPYYQVIGNHDASNAMMQQVYLERYGDRFPMFYSFDHEKYHFIVLDSDKYGEYDNIIAEQLAWLKADLERNRDARNTFVFVHKPLWRFGNSNWMKDVHPLLVEHGVDSVFAGHWHVYRKSGVIDGIRYIVTGGAGAEINGTDLMGYFYHYLLLTVRDGTVSNAVIRTGYIENDEIVNQDLLAKAREVAGKIGLILVPIERGGTQLPQQIEIVIPNPFDTELSGTLAWDEPKGSPWRFAENPMAVSIQPGQEQRLTIQTPPGGSAADIKSLEPFPLGKWNLSVGSRTFLVGEKAAVIIDLWPYLEHRRQLERIGNMLDVEKVVVSPEVSTTLHIPVKNATQWRMEGKLRWVTPTDCRWKVWPAAAFIDLAPGEEQEIKFNVAFLGTIEQVFPLPRLKSSFALDGEDILRTSAELQVDAREHLSKQIRVVRCVRAETPPKLDGILDEPMWGAGPVASDFMFPHADGVARYQTETRFAYDAENLYMAFRCLDPNIKGLLTKATRRDIGVYQDDCVEIFLDTNLDRETYFQYILSANGVIYDAEGHDDSWNKPCTVKAGREDAAWTLEVAIPWTTLRMDAPAPGTKIGLELVRNRRAGATMEWSQWSPTLTDSNHELRRFGELSLD